MVGTKVRRSAAWVTVPNGKEFIKSGGVWKSPLKVYVKKNGVWVDTGFVGVPNAPLTPAVVSDDYTHLQVTVNPSSSGVPATSIRVQLLNNGGGLLQTTDITPGGSVNFTGLAQDTQYIVRAYAIAGGVLSIASPDLRRQTGHPEQGYNQANYGWGPSKTARPAQVDGTSEYLPGGTYPGANAVDMDPATAWVSGARDAQLGGGYWEGLRFQVGGNRLYNSFSVYGPGPQVVWLGIYTLYIEPRWVGQNFTTIGMDGSAPALLQHSYFGGIGNGVEVKSFGFSYQQVLYFDVAITNLQPWPLAYRAQINDVYYTYQDWEIVSYTWVVTVAYAGNSYW